MKNSKASKGTVGREAHSPHHGKLSENRISSEVFVTKQQLADHFQVCLSTVDNWLTAGLPRLKLGRAVRLDLDEVSEWLRRRAS